MDNHPLSFLHLSDMHFKEASNSSVYDLNSDLRKEFIRSVERTCGEKGKPNGIFITGDIAWSGKKVEFEKAYQWLNLLCDALKCEISMVWCVPGNHDIQRSKRLTVGFMRKQLCSCSVESIDETIDKLLPDFNILYEQLSQYNKFALQFNCLVSRDDPIWKVDFPLGNGCALRVHGLNSVLASGDNDGNGKENKVLVLGKYQCQIEQNQQKGIYNAVLCHHPPNWLRDGYSVQQALNPRAVLQLFGHEHEEKLNSTHESVMISAGALHPARDGCWDPRYNRITVCLDDFGDSRNLRVEVESFQWQEKSQRFVQVCCEKENGLFCSNVFSIDCLPSATEHDQQVEPVTPSDDIGLSEQEAVEVEDTMEVGDRIMNTSRVLTQRIVSVKYIHPMQQFWNIGLPEVEADENKDTKRTRS